MIKPILAALKHHKTAAILIALEIALTCAIITNALFVIGAHVQHMHVSTGVADNELSWARPTSIDDVNDKPAHVVQNAEQQEDLAALMRVPGVRSASVINTLPLNGNSWTGSIWTEPGATPAMRGVSFYLGGPRVVPTLGLKITQGRDFLPAEYTDANPDHGGTGASVAIVPKAMADRLWPGKNPLNQVIFNNKDGKSPIHIVGVVERLLSPSVTVGGQEEQNILLPSSYVSGGTYVLRSANGVRSDVLRNVPGALDAVDAMRVVDAKGTLTDLVHEHFHDDRALVWLLLCVIAALLALTILGIVGLTSFWVQQRIRSIGIRRAIGATRNDIRNYFQVENLLIVGAGVVAGSGGAIGLNLWLMKAFELPHMPVWVVAPGALILFVTGQAAALVPALRAARIPPSAAIRA